MLLGTGGAPHGSLWFLAIYAGISATQIVFQLSSTLLLKILSLAAARTMHNNMLKSLLRSALLLHSSTTPACGHSSKSCTAVTVLTDYNRSHFSYIVSCMLHVVGNLVCVRLLQGKSCI